MDIQRIQDSIREWSDETFGVNRTGIPISHNLKKEVDEVIDALNKFHGGRPYSGNSKRSLKLLMKRRKRVRFELADCMMLILDIAAHEQITFNYLMEAVEEKLEVNKTRKWGSPDKNGVVKQITKDGKEIQGNQE